MLRSVVNVLSVLAAAVDRTVRRQQKGEVVKMTAQDNVDDLIEQFDSGAG